MAAGFERTGELLATLAAIGRPVLHRHADGCWSVVVEFPSPKGVTAKVSSDYDHPSPDAALQTCIDRLGGLRSMLSVPSPVPGVTHQQVDR